MKKLLYTIGMTMMLTAALQPAGLLKAEQFSGKDEDVPFSSARLASKIEKAIGLDPAANWKEIFGAKEDKNVGKDLYMVIYKKTQDEPQKQAGKNIAGKYGMPETEMVRILQGDYTKMVEKKPGMTQEEAMKKIAEIQQLYAEEKDLLQLKADIKAAVEPNEIFANGDINDSGFDLINDLQIIENLLFLKSDPIDVGGTFGGGDEGGGAEGTGSTSQASTGGTQGAGTGGTAGSGGDTGTTVQAVTESESGTTGGAAGGGTGGTGEAGSGSAAGAPGGLNPISCFASNALGKALSAFEEKKGTDSNFKDNSKGQTPYSGGTTGGTGAPGSGGGGTGGGGGGGGAGGAGTSTAGGTSTTTDFMPPKADTAVPAKAAPPGEWLKEKLCPGFFCLDVKMVMAPAKSAYQNADNCIACHAEKINDTLKKVINHTLVPSKAPGNLGESAKCKKAIGTAFGSISMNFYAVAMPVLTPVNDDLVYGMNIEDDWYNYCNAVSFPFSCRKEKAPASPEASTYVIPPSVSDMASKKEISNSTAYSQLESVSRNVEIAVVGMQTERQAVIQAYTVSQKADNAIGSFNPLKVEMNLMNYYFSNIRDLLHSLHEKVDSIPGTQACTVLRDKKECT